MKWIPILCMFLTLASCRPKEAGLTVEQIVDRAILDACDGHCETATIEFTFRGRGYKSERRNGAYQFQRIFNDSTGSVRDVLSNEGFRRYRNDTLVPVVDSMASRYANSVNSVHYFVQLPYGLNDSAARKELIGEAVINGKPYYEVEVTFVEEGGGTDFDDRFLYWIHKENFTVDFLAYSYATDGGGTRFREAYNVREVEGIRFVDYNNYKPKSKEVTLSQLKELFEKGELQLLSKIETEDIRVKIQ